MKRTEELNAALSTIEDKFNLNNVSITGDDIDQKNAAGLYTFENQDYKAKDIKGGEDTLNEFIDIGRRERN